MNLKIADLMPILIYSLIIIILVLSRAYRLRCRMIDLSNQKLMRNIAKKYGWEYRDKIGIDKKENSFQLFNSGEGRKLSNYIQGRYKNHGVEIYNYEHKFLHFLSWHFNKLKHLVLEIKISKTVPRAIIATSYFRDYDYINFVSSNRLETESNEFNKQFIIRLDKFSKDTSEESVLEIITPNIMEALLAEQSRERNKGIYIEMNGNRFILCKTIFMKHQT